MRIAAVIQRDLLRFSRNPGFILASVVLPLVYLVIMGNAFQGELKHLTLVVVDQDKGPYSRRVIELMQAMEKGKKTIDISMLNDQKQAYVLVRSGKVRGGLIIPPNFSADVVKNLKPQIGLLLDNTDAISANTIQGALSKALGYLRSDYIPIRVDTASAQVKPINLFRKIDYDASLVPGALVMAIFMGTMITGAFNLVMDKFLGVHESYLSTPLTKRDIVIGTISSGVFISTMMSFIVLIAGMLITGTKLYGGIPALLILFFTISLSSLGLLSMMFIILGRADHPRIVGLISGFLNVIFFFPSGAVYPIESFPGWLRAFARINPETYAVHAFKALIFKGAEFSAIRNDLIFLVIFTVIMLTVATWTFKRTM